MRIVALGKPITQGSKRHVGNGVMVESSKYAKPWRERVHQAAIEALDGKARIEGPVNVRAIFYFDRPKTHYRTGANAHLLRDKAPVVPATRASGDIDKLLRSCLDSLTSAGVWQDDAQVVCAVASKVWTNSARADYPPLHVPGVTIDVYPLDPGGVA